MITSLHGELEQSKEKQSKLEKELNDVDYNSKKSVEEIQDKMDVERCVIEMVSWVSEQLNNQQHVEQMTLLHKSIKGQ